MADSKLRLTIQTALDNAGIKATEAQIQGIEQSLTKANANFKNSSKDTLTGVDKGIDTMRRGVKTFMKDVAIAAGATKLIGTAMAEIYQSMIGEGKSFSEAFSSMWSNLADRMRKVFFGTSVREIWDEVAKGAEKAAQDQIDAQNKVIEKLDESRRKINDNTLAYIAQKDAVTKLRNAGNDSEMLRLSREKIINTEKMKSFGDDAGAEQLGKLYDYLIEQRTAENDLAFAQREFEKAEVKWAADEEKLKSISDSLAKLSTRLASSENAWKKVGQEIAMATAEVEDESIKNSMADKISKARLKEYQAAQKAYKKIKEQYDKQLDVLNLNETEENTLLQQYENTRMKADLRLYERSKDYNDFLTENGDVIQSNRDWLKNERWAPQKVTDFYNDLVEDVSESIKEMNQTYEDKFYTTETYQAKIADNTANLAEKLDMLLQMK